LTPRTSIAVGAHGEQRARRDFGARIRAVSRQIRLTDQEFG
jgi:hypothetical protein